MELENKLEEAQLQLRSNEEELINLRARTTSSVERAQLKATKGRMHADKVAQQAECNKVELALSNKQLRAELDFVLDKNKALSIKVDNLEELAFEFNGFKDSNERLVQAASSQLQQAVVDIFLAFLACQIFSFFCCLHAGRALGAGTFDSGIATKVANRGGVCPSNAQITAKARAQPSGE